MIIHPQKNHFFHCFFLIFYTEAVLLPLDIYVDSSKNINGNGSALFPYNDFTFAVKQFQTNLTSEYTFHLNNETTEISISFTLEANITFMFFF